MAKSIIKPQASAAPIKATVSDTLRFTTNNKLIGQTLVVAAPAPPPIIVRDNTKFATFFDASKVTAVFKPTRTLVVGQSPRPDELVPVGTPIDLVVTVKQLLPIEGIKNLHPVVAEKFRARSVGDVLSTLTQFEAKRVFETADATSYEKLTASDKTVVNEYLRGTFGINGAEDPAGAAGAYDNVKFMVDF